MNTKLTGYVWDGCAASGMKLSSVAIMARLAGLSNDEGVRWPSIETIAHQLGAGPNTVRTAIAKPEKDGWLTRTQRRNGNRNASSVYRPNVAKLQAAAFSQLPDSDTSKSDALNFDTSKTDPSKSGKNGGFDPSESSGDPSVKSKQDPQVASKPSCSIAAQPDPEVVITDQARQILSYLNQTTGSRYQICSTSLESIRARLREQFTVNDLCLVVDYKNTNWRDSEQAQYLRPVTLFIPKNFSGYLQSATEWSAAGRPERVNGKWTANSASRANFQNVDCSLPENSGFRS